MRVQELGVSMEGRAPYLVHSTERPSKKGTPQSMAIGGWRRGWRCPAVTWRSLTLGWERLRPRVWWGPGDGLGP